MNIAYSDIYSGFLDKISEFELGQLAEATRQTLIDGYMRRAVVAFKSVCKYDLSLYDDTLRAYTDDFAAEDVDEIIDIISDGMVLNWLKPYLNQQMNLENVMNTADYSMYSPAGLLQRIGDAYDRLKKEYVQEIREYSYNHNDLTGLHL